MNYHHGNQKQYVVITMAATHTKRCKKGAASTDTLRTARTHIYGVRKLQT